MLTSEILKQAAVVVRGGWCRFVRHGEKGRVCALGALETAVGGDGYLLAERACQEAINALAALLPQHPSEPTDLYPLSVRVAQWNNADDQTAENVALTCELAAIVAEQHEQTAVDQPEAVGAVARIADRVTGGDRARKDF